METVAVSSAQSQMMEGTPPQSPMLMYSQQSPVPTPPAASPHSHPSPRPDLHQLSQLSEDKMDSGLASPRPPSVPPNPQFQIRLFIFYFILFFNFVSCKELLF